MPQVPEVVVPAVEAKVKEHMQRCGKGEVTLPDENHTVLRVLQGGDSAHRGICDHQGEFLRGSPKREVIEKIVAALVKVAAEHRAA